MTAEQELDNIEKIKVAVEVAANTMDFGARSTMMIVNPMTMALRRGAVMQKVQNAIDRFSKPGKPGFQIKYDRTPRD